MKRRCFACNHDTVYRNRQSFRFAEGRRRYTGFREKEKGEKGEKGEKRREKREGRR
jgi:hypothetical protein